MLKHFEQYKRIPWMGIAASLTFLISSAVSAEEAMQQVPVTLKASVAGPKALLSGEGYSVGETVSNDGFQNTYIVSSDYGDATVIGNGALAARAMEIRAIRLLEEIESSDAFKEGVKGSASDIVEGGKALVKEPIETTKGAAKGVGRWLGNVGRSVTSKDPHQDNVAKTLLGYDGVKRAYAVELGVDPNTDFEPFTERLTRVSRAATAGGLTLSMVTDAVTEGTTAGTVLMVTSTANMKELLKDNPPSALAKINKEKLGKMGIAELNSDALLKNYNYTPMQMTIMVDALQRMGDIDGRDIFVAYATAAPDDIIARYVQESAEMLTNYIAKNESGSIVAIDSQAWFLTKPGKLVGTFPIDYLAWTDVLAIDAEAVDCRAGSLGFKSKELLVEGMVDPAARKALESRGWKISENVQLAATMVVSK